jgi:hypothetical protein
MEAHSLRMLFEEIEHGLVCIVGELETLIIRDVNQSVLQASWGYYKPRDLAP